MWSRRRRVRGRWRSDTCAILCYEALATAERLRQAAGEAGGVTVVSVDLPATAAADDSAAVTGAGGVTVSDPVTTPPAVIAGGAHQSDTAVILVTPSHNFAQRPCSCSLVPPCLFGAAQLASGVLGRFFFENREVASS